MTLSAVDRTIYAFRRNVVVAASAGTGKTHRLTALYVLLTLGLTSMGRADERAQAAAVAPGRIVATTFSRAAAREIAARVDKALAGVAAWDGTSRLPLFDAEIRARAEEVGAKLDGGSVSRAQQARARAGDARIDTIHGLARRIVVRHGLALGEPRARVLDEVETSALADRAVTMALGDALEAGGERRDAVRTLLAAAGGIVLLREQLGKFFDRLDEEGLAISDLALADHVGDARALESELRTIAAASADRGSAAFRAPARDVLRALDAHDGARSLGDAVAALFTVRMPGKKEPADDALDTLRRRVGGKGTHAEKARRLVALLSRAPLLPARDAAVRALLEETRARVDLAKRDAGGLGFGDLLRIARDALRDRPEIAHAERGSFDALLVDEFQDTSRVQRNLVYLLRERDDTRRPPGSLPSAPDLAEQGLFLVGDRKQSIYGFRSADVAVFARTCHELCGRAAVEALALQGAATDTTPVADFVALRESRRSAPQVVAFVNAFATSDFTAPNGHAFELRYGPGDVLVAMDEPRRTDGEVVFVRDDGRSPPEAPPLVSDASGPAREAHVAAALVARGAAQGRFAFGDVAVLTRRRSTIPLVELALSRLEIPYVVAGRALYDTLEVRDVAALVRLLVDPTDRHALATVLRGPAVALSDGALAMLSATPRGLQVDLASRKADPPALPVAERARLDAFRDRFAAFAPIAPRLEPGEAVRHTLRLFELDRVVAALPRARARIANLDRLVAIARRQRGTLASFSRWLDARIADETDEPEAVVFAPGEDAVRITTIHGSKGLAFPVVVLLDLNAAPARANEGVSIGATDGAPGLVVRHHAPRLDRTRAPGDESMPLVVPTPWLLARHAEMSARERAERARLTYVALTRAERTVMLVGSAGRARDGSAMATLAANVDEPGFADCLTASLDACDVLAAASVRPAAPEPASAPAPPQRPGRTRAASIAIATTALAMFGSCPRRFHLRHVLGLDEPVATSQLDLFEPDPRASNDARADDRESDPREQGRAAHRVLERWPLGGGLPEFERVSERLAAEGPAADSGVQRALAERVARTLGGAYFASLAGASEVRREAVFVVPVGATRSTGLLLRGAIDLLVRWPNGRVDVVDYKLASPRDDLDAYAFQLRAYALAVKNAHPDARVAAGVLFVGAAAPRWLGKGPLEDAEHGGFATSLRKLAERFSEARATDRFAPVALPSCRKLGCGFVAACHGRGA